MLQGRHGRTDDERMRSPLPKPENRRWIQEGGASRSGLSKQIAGSGAAYGYCSPITVPELTLALCFLVGEHSRFRGSRANHGKTGMHAQKNNNTIGLVAELQETPRQSVRAAR